MHRLAYIGTRRPRALAPWLLAAGLLVFAVGGAAAWAQSLQPAQTPHTPQTAAPPGDQELIAVLDLKAAGASDVEALALTERLREVLLKTDRFILVDRSQMDALLNEQAFQQTGCTEQDCAVQVGRILGVRKIVAGRAIKVSDNVWLLSALLVDVETARTLRAESLRHRGDFFDLLDRAVVSLGARLAGAARPAEAPPAPSTTQTAAARSAPAAPAPRTLHPPSERNRKRLALFPARLQGELVSNLTADEKRFGAALVRILGEKLPWVELTLSAYDGQAPSPAYSAYRAHPSGARWGEEAWSGLFTVEPDEDHIRALFPRREVELALLIRSTRDRQQHTAYGVYLLDLERGRRFESTGNWVPGRWGKTVRAALREVFRDYRESWR